MVEVSLLQVREVELGLDELGEHDDSAGNDEGERLAPTVVSTCFFFFFLTASKHRNNLQDIGSRKPVRTPYTGAEAKDQ